MEFPSVASYLARGKLPPWIYPPSRFKPFVFSRVYAGNVLTPVFLGEIYEQSWTRIFGLTYRSGGGILASLHIRAEGLGLDCWHICPRPGKNQEQPIFFIIPPQTRVRIWKEGPSSASTLDQVRLLGWGFSL